MNKRIQNDSSEVKSGRLEQACARYGLVKHSMRNVAESAGAVIRVGRSYLINYTLVDTYLDHLSGE